ncbi:glycosyltransferase [Bacillus sp. FJAT-29937]|uniref:glycosyltransferase n=1 Tax=Bacillus sp. FJAT-29937 TaxID=1720553 RepID=UPI000835DC8C|nr:glycosyltransferase [Bacillus sp. FJAT-29937]
MTKKILIFDRIDSSKFPGGDTIQINAIYNFLLKHGFTVDISENPLTNLNKYDFIFIFNLTNPLEAYLFAESATKYNKPYILFPVYWNLDTLRYSNNINLRLILKRFMPNWSKWVYRVTKFTINNFTIIKKLRINPFFLFREQTIYDLILRRAKIICPNSYAELEHLEFNFPFAKMKPIFKVIYNGIDLKALNSFKSKNIGNSVTKKYKLPSNYVCCVGGIGPRKNQLNLVKAANRTGIPLVIVGKAAKGYEGYFEKLKKFAKDNIFFLGQLPHEEVFDVLINSAGHIQPSYIETPGLASLEALAIGRPICVSNTPPVVEYFKEHAVYCNPNDIESISEGLESLFKNEVNIYSANYIKENFDWNKTLKKILTIFNE